jgi:transposase
MNRARYAGLTWAQAEALDDDELTARLYGTRSETKKQREQPDFAHVQIELRRPGVTLERLHWEYVQDHPGGYYGYSRFCELYKEWRKNRGLSMRQQHRGGEKLFIDYSGKKPHIIDPKTGEVREVELFVAVLGASNYTYAEATYTQKSQDFIASHVRALEHMGGVPGALVPDQLKSAVTRSGRYEMTIQRTYAEMARHYGTAVVPARPYKPRDKAKAEVAVQIVQRYVLGHLRNRQFFSLEALNECIREKLEELNNKPMRKYGGATRKQLFEKLDRPALSPLPTERFVYAAWKRVKVNIDYHVEVAKHYYSVPYQLVGEYLEARFTATTVELYHKGKRVAGHVRSYHGARHTTNVEHMPKAHRKHLEWSPSRLMNWATKTGPSVAVLVKDILESRPHPEQGYRSCLGILRLSKRYGEERLNAACERALRVSARSYRSVESILRKGLDRASLDDSRPSDREALEHDNVRGAEYYERERP